MTQELKAHPAAEIFPLIDSKGLAELAGDIERYGQREAIVLYEGMILDGRNRFRACQFLKREARTVEWDGSGGSPTAFVLSLNLHRRHLDASQRAMVAARARTLFEEEARARMTSTLLRGGAAPLASIGASGKSAEHAARSLNVSPGSVERATKVLRDGVPELAAAVEAGRIAVSTAADVAEASHEEQREVVAKGEREILAKAKEIRARKQETRRVERAESLAAISKGNRPIGELPPCPLLYADPPWRYEHVETESRAIENHYPTMALDEICAMKPPTLDDCVLFLWATSPKLEEALRVVAAWGFTYRTSMVWVKDKIGMGYYARQRHELLLICTKGSPPVPAPSVRPDSVQDGVRSEHSAKPDAFYDLIESMYPEWRGCWAELFQRRERDGWIGWGNQAGSEAA